jgi:hypothetical protein
MPSFVYGCYTIVAAPRSADFRAQRVELIVLCALPSENFAWFIPRLNAAQLHNYSALYRELRAYEKTKVQWLVL